MSITKDVTLRERERECAQARAFTCVCACVSAELGGMRDKGVWMWMVAVDMSLPEPGK